MHRCEPEAQRMKRVYSLARWPLSLAAFSHSSPEQFAETPIQELELLIEAIDQALRRERAKSAMRHWTYDVNRHIAIKAARDRIIAAVERKAGCRPGTRKKPRGNPRLSVCRYGSD